MSNSKNVTIYVDGACITNPGPGGYGIILDYEDRRKELSGGFMNTTNNRMEIMAVIIALEALKKKYLVMVFSDSQYVVRAMSEGWAEKWQAQGWKRNRKQRALNPDLWQRLLELCELHEVDFQWIKGHNLHPENERCDQLANEAAMRSDLPIDDGYENPPHRLF